MRSWKGFEHRICHALQAMGFKAKRTTSGRQGQRGEGGTADIEAEGYGKKFLVEVKFTNQTKYATSRPVKLEWLRKLEKQASDQGRTPVLAFNYPTRGYYVVLRLQDLESLCADRDMGL